jgi:6-phosphofructokinase 1
MALKFALEGKTGIMAGFEREGSSDGTYKIHVIDIPIEEVMMNEKTLPNKYISDRGNDVNEIFIEWCRPLIGQPLKKYIELR